MAPIQKRVSAAKHAGHAREIVCIRIGPYSLIQGEAVWQDGDQACIFHLGRETVGWRVNSVRRS